MTPATQAAVTAQVFRIFIKASPQKIWDAITQPEWAVRYGYRAPFEYDLRPGGAFRVFPTDAMSEYGAPAVIIDGEVIESDPPHRLVQSWHALWDPQLAAEAPTRVTWEIQEGEDGISALTVTHELEGAPTTATVVSGDDPNAGGGWAWIISDLKSLLETGSSLRD